MLRRLLRLLPKQTISGYEHPELVETVFRKTVAYAPTEKLTDVGVARTVLDFGGGCGIHYKEAFSDARWAVVETPAMAAKASELATDKLSFFTDIRAAADWLGSVDMMHSNGALLYAPDPRAVLRELVALRAGTMLWKRLTLFDREGTVMQTSNLVDNGPGRIKAKNKLVQYQMTHMSEAEFMAAHVGYRLVDQGTNAYRFQLQP